MKDENKKLEKKNKKRKDKIEKLKVTILLFETILKEKIKRFRKYIKTLRRKSSSCLKVPR